MKNKVGTVRNCRLEELEDFQGNLKGLPEEHYERLKRSLLANGFIAPFFIWGQKILDGHQRKAALLRMAGEGIEVPEVFPCVEIEAETELQAKKFVLQFVSAHGQVTEVGLEEFLKEAGILLGDISDEVDLPGIDLDALLSEEDRPDPELDDQYKEQYGVIVICESESNQAEIYERLAGEGYDCKVVVT